MTLHAQRTAVNDLDQATRVALWRAAARTGVLYADGDVVRCGFGTACRIALPGGIIDVDAPAAVERALAASDLRGDDGPSGTGVVAFGSLPFDAAGAAVLEVPTLVCAWRPGTTEAWITVVGASSLAEPRDAVREATADGGALEAAAVIEIEFRPDAAGYADAVQRALDLLPRRGIAKVVLARRAIGRCDREIDAAWLADDLERREPTCTIYSVPLAAGRFVGASPELIVATHDGAVSAHPLAGTVALAGDARDAAQVEWLERSDKDRVEHAAVVDDIAARLAPWCDTVVAAESPSIVSLSSVAHLGTWIDGKLRDPAGRTAMAVLAALHPTPAVGGVPRDGAVELIEELEDAARGPYAGAVGYVDADGASSWTLGIRGVLVDADSFVAWAGAGVVEGSVPSAEADETETKLASVLRSLGC